ncbi:MAG: ABC transporter permease [Chitinophagales bacterium]|nr:ABC transporter permease [Chitinophagales bacterium]
MNNPGQIVLTSITQAIHELRANKLRTFLSLLGITIGIFCIIAVFTVLDSMKNNIRTEISSLGSDVLYIGRWPWMDEGGEYKWWEFLRRPSMGPTELKAVERDVKTIEFATLSYRDGGLSLKHNDLEITGITGYAVTNFFDKIQNIEIDDGRYLSLSEIDGGANSVVIGSAVYDALFPGGSSAIGKKISFRGRSFNVVGVMRKVGQNMAGFNFDNGIIYSYYAAAGMVDVKSLNNDPTLIIKTGNAISLEDTKLEVEGALRRVRKVRPGEKNNFAINQLSQITERLEMMFGKIDLIAIVIGGFSILVGAFGIANIMFVTVKERTKMIGLKKAIGAKSGSILLEFLVEAVTLSIFGGLLGIVFVMLLAVILSSFADFAVRLSLQNFIIGISISAVVGILAGFIPARTASRLNPVVAIRSH